MEISAPNHSVKDVNIVKQSLERCLEATDFLNLFYELFLASSPQVKEKFKNTSFSRQSIMLKGSLQIMLLYADGRLSDDGGMRQLAKVHDRDHREVKPELYSFWLNCMIETVRQSDPQFSAELENSWRAVMQPGIDYMISHY